MGERKKLFVGMARMARLLACSDGGDASEQASEIGARFSIHSCSRHQRRWSKKIIASVITKCRGKKERKRKRKATDDGLCKMLVHVICI